MDPVFQRLGDVTIQRLEKPKDKVGPQGSGDIMEKENKEERHEQNVNICPRPGNSMLNPVNLLCIDLEENIP